VEDWLFVFFMFPRPVNRDYRNGFKTLLVVLPTSKQRSACTANQPTGLLRFERCFSVVNLSYMHYQAS